jgi:hypothetical protein
MKRTNQVNHPSELSALSVMPWRRMPGSGRILIADASVPEDVRHGWEQRLNRLYFACGCDRAAAGLAVGVVAFAAWTLLKPGSWSALDARDVLTGIGMVVLFAGIGKLLGLMRADRRLKQTTRDIQAQWKRPRPRDGQISRCG